MISILNNNVKLVEQYTNNSPFHTDSANNPKITYESENILIENCIDYSIN